MTSNRFLINSPRFLRPTLILIKNNCVSCLSSHESFNVEAVKMASPSCGAESPSLVTYKVFDDLDQFAKLLFHHL